MQKIINLMRTLNYPIESKGVCAGLSQMWQQAFLSGGAAEEYKFLARIDRINTEYTNKELTKDNIAQKLEEVHNKVKKGEELNEHDLFLQEVEAMFEGIAIYQSVHKLDKGLFAEKLPSFDDVDQIATVAASQALEEKGGLVKLYKEPVVCTNAQLQSYFDKLRDVIKDDAQDLSISLGSGMHRIAVRYDATNENWTLINPGEELDQGLAYKKDSEGNKISLKETIDQNLKTPHDRIGQAVGHSLSLESNSLFNVIINTTGNNKNISDLTTKLENFKSENLQSLTKENVKLTNRGLSLISLGILGNNVDFVKKFAEDFKEEFKENINIKTKDTSLTPLEMAVNLDRPEIIKILLENGALKYKNEEGETPIVKAINENNWDFVYKVLSSTSNQNQFDTNDILAFKDREVRDLIKKNIGEVIQEKIKNNGTIPIEQILNIKNSFHLKSNDPVFKDLQTALPLNHPIHLIHPLLGEIERLKASDGIFISSSKPKVNVLERLIKLIENPDLCQKLNGKSPATYGEVIHQWKNELYVGSDNGKYISAGEIIRQKRGLSANSLEKYIDNLEHRIGGNALPAKAISTGISLQANPIEVPSHTRDFKARLNDMKPVAVATASLAHISKPKF